MGRIRVAVADDDNQFLDDEISYLKDLSNDVEIVFSATSKKEFYERMKAHPAECIDALILDIEMDTRTAGLDIAMRLCKPVLFTSGWNRDFLDKIEKLEDSISVVEHLSKPYTEDEFKRRVQKFCKHIRLEQQSERKLTLKLDGKSENVSINDIACICAADKGDGAEGNDKVIFFTNRKPAKLNRFALESINEWNVPDNPMCRISKSCAVNRNVVHAFDRKEAILVVFNEKNEKIEKKVPISENYSRVLDKK
ncbi:MAG: response regulator [Bacteroidales bacterium]|nr:response regulator [Bacteroidales bacterium]